MLHLRETLTMPASYYSDITDTISADKMEEMKESVNQSLSKVKRGKSKMLESVSDDKIMSVLKEAKYTDSIVERVVAKLREGGVDVGKQRIYRVPVARINPPGTLNGNRRRYPAALWENVMNNQGDAWKGLCGLADHPSDDTDPGSFKNSSIVWLGMDIDKNSNIVYGIGTFVGPYGHLAQEIIDAGGRVGFSSSGFGELMSDGETVNPDTYQIERLADVVLNPSQSVYGSISDETNLGNIEYTKKQAVSESVENKENRIQENTTMDAKETGVKSALSKIEEKELRKHINNYLKENVEITNPIKQLQDLKDIQALIQEGQLSDMEETVTTKLAEAQKRIEEMVEYGLKMKEAEVSIEAGAPEDTKVEVGADGAVEVTVGDAPVATVEPAPAMDIPAEAPIDTVVEPSVGDEIPAEEPTDAEIDAAIDGAVDEIADEDSVIVESTLTGRNEAAIREYVENFLNADHTAQNPLDVIAETNEILALVKEDKLLDLEESVVARIESLQTQLNEDIASAHQMKLDLQAGSVNEINESAKSIMKSGKLLIDQVADYKELCEALTKRNQQLMKEYNEMKANAALLEAKNEDNDLAKNQKIVSLSEKVNELTENFDNLDVKAGAKVTELQEALEAANKELETYKEGNAKLEKALGLANTKLKEAKAKFDNASDEILALKESLAAKEAEPAKEKLTESTIVAGPIDTTAFEEMKAENESLKAALASFKEAAEKPQTVDVTKLDEAAQREVKVLKDEIKLLKTRLGENVDNYVKTMEGSVTSYYNDLEAKYGEAIKPYKNSFLKARSLREAQRMFMNVVKELQTSEVFEESVQEEVPADTLSSGKTSDFYEGNTANDAGSFAASFGLR